MTDYEFYKQVTNSGKWKPQPIHRIIRFWLRLIVATLMVWALLCGTILLAPVHADSLTVQTEQEWLFFVGIQANEDSITSLLYVDSEGNVERFTWYDELKNYNNYTGSYAVWEKETDMMAVYDSNLKCTYSDWD